jgi:hypothetical protein
MEETPHKRRFSIWKALAIAPVVLVLIAVFAHGIWRANAKARLDKQVAALIAAGEPMRIEDFSETPLTEDQNLVPLIFAAKRLEQESVERSERERDLHDNDPYAFRQPLTEPEVALLREHLGANAGALAVLRELDTKAGAFWNDLPASMTFGYLMPELNQVRAMANLLADDARLAMHERRWDDVVADIVDIQALANSMQGRPGLVGALVGIGIHRLATEVALDAAASLETSGESGAPREDVQRLVRSFLDDQLMIDNMQKGLRSERYLIQGAMLSMGQAPTAAAPAAPAAPGAPVRWNGLVRYAMKPALYSNASASLEVFDELLKVADRPSLKAFAAASGPLDAKMSELKGSKVLVLASILTPSMRRYVETGYNVRVDRHLAATALAARLYAIDHNGQLPPALEALVPDYLPVVPADSIDGAPLRYDPARGILWSVGSDEKDGGGDESMLRTIAHFDRWQLRDVVVHLAPQPRPVPAPTEDVDVEADPATTQP